MRCLAWYDYTLCGRYSHSCLTEHDEIYYDSTIAAGLNPLNECGGDSKIVVPPLNAISMTWSCLRS